MAPINTPSTLRPPRVAPHAQAGFTLIELVMVIVLIGIIGAMVSSFIRAPVEGYLATARRAELADITDTAMRRMARDIHLALPNTVRNSSDGSTSCVEFMPTKTGGRYRATTDGSGAGNVLDFTQSTSTFDVFAPTYTDIAAGDIIAINNDGSGKSDCTGTTANGGAGGNAYCGYNAIQVASISASNVVTLVGSGTATPFNLKQFPLASPTYRFSVIPASEHVAAYVCSGVGVSGGNGTGTLYRYSRTLTSARLAPATCSAMSSGASAAVVANNVSGCTLKYEPPGSATPIGLGNNGIMVLSLQVMESGEAVNIYQQIQVDNAP